MREPIPEDHEDGTIDRLAAGVGDRRGGVGADRVQPVERVEAARLPRGARPRPLVLSRPVTPRPRVAAYWAVLGVSPVCGPGDRRAAAAFLARIEQALERGGWTKTEWRNLQGLYETWSRRAAGMDPRFELAGVRAGRLPRDAEAWIRTRQKHHAMAEHIRVAQVVNRVNAADPRTRPSDDELKRRRRLRDLPPSNHETVGATRETVIGGDDAPQR
jgi:hypothetical protein